MTGFGRAQGEMDGLTVRVEARSVNNRYLKLSVRLPEGWQSQQFQLEKAAKSALSRGTVTITVHRRGTLKEEAACRVNAEVAADYRRQLAELDARPEEIPLSLLVTLPGVLVSSVDDEQDTEDQVGRFLLEVTGQAVDELVRMRRTEGEHITAVLVEIVEVVERLLQEVRAGLPVMLDTYRERLTQRMKDLLSGSGVSVDPDVLVREVAVFAERSDVAEEIARLESHLGQFKENLSRDEPMGRQLEFLVQEMFREANTMASKAGGVEVTRLVLELKGHVDRLKEQVLNVE